MNIGDSSGWLEYFAAGSNADFFREPIEDISNLIVPTISLIEVFKRVLQQRSESEALQAVAYMQSGRILDLTSTIALHAVKLSDDEKIQLLDFLRQSHGNRGARATGGGSKITLKRKTQTELRATVPAGRGPAGRGAARTRRRTRNARRPGRTGCGR